MNTWRGPADTVLATLYEFWQGFLQTLPRLGFALVAVLVTAVAARFVPRGVVRLWSHAVKRRSLRDLIRQLTFIGIWLLGALIASMILFPSLTPGRLVAVVGLGSIAIGFAFKDIFENFFAGILILWRFPIENGDLIECEGIEGRVEDVTIRMTLIRQTDGQLVTVPNAMLFKNPVTVRTALDTRRVTVTCGIAYSEDVDAARSVLERAVDACQTVRRDRPIEIFAQSFGESSVDFEVTWWTGSQPLEVRRSRDEVVAAVKRALDEAGIEIPYPYRVLTFKEPVRIAEADELPRAAARHAPLARRYGSGRKSSQLG